MYRRVTSSIVLRSELAGAVQVLARAEAARPDEWQQGYRAALLAVSDLYGLDVALGVQSPELAKGWGVADETD